MQIHIGNISEQSLLDYLKKTPLADKVDVEEYTRKVYPRATIFMVREGAEIVGVNIVYFNDMETKRGFVTYIHVNEKYRNMRIGWNLLQSAVDYARTHQFESIALEVRKNNEPAKHLYSKFGFVIYDENDISYFMRKVIL